MSAKRIIASAEERPRTDETIRLRDRKRQLNVIYFIDSDKTRSFTLSLKAFYGLGAASLTIILWALLSMQLIYSLSRSNDGQNLQIQTLLTTIFDYQTRYDQVFERAYPAAPKTETANTLQANELDANEELRIVATDQEEIPLAEQGPRIISKETAEAQAKTPKAPKAAQDVANSTLPVMESPSISTSKAGVNVKFGIRNAPGMERSQGLLWGVAAFEKPDGSLEYVSAPEGIPMDDHGQPKNLDRALRFNIRFFKSKDLTFKKPLTQASVFKELTIYLRNLSGQQTEQTVTAKETRQIKASSGNNNPDTL